MTITVLGIDEGMKKRVTCSNCGSILQYLPVDVKKEVHHDYGGGRDTYYHITCLSCWKKVSVRG